MFSDGTQFTVKVFIGVEYECHRGHRFICSDATSAVNAPKSMVKENATRIANSDMPLYIPCVCRQVKNLSLFDISNVIFFVVVLESHF